MMFCSLVNIMLNWSLSLPGAASVQALITFGQRDICVYYCPTFIDFAAGFQVVF